MYLLGQFHDKCIKTWKWPNSDFGDFPDHRWNIALLTVSSDFIRLPCPFGLLTVCRYGFHMIDCCAHSESKYDFIHCFHGCHVTAVFILNLTVTLLTVSSTVMCDCCVHSKPNCDITHGLLSCRRTAASTSSLKVCEDKVNFKSCQPRTVHTGRTAEGATARLNPVLL